MNEINPSTILFIETHRDGIARAVAIEYIEYLAYELNIPLNQMCLCLEYPEDMFDEYENTKIEKSLEGQVMKQLRDHHGRPSTPRANPYRDYHERLEKLVAKGLTIVGVDNNRGEPPQFSIGTSMQKRNEVLTGKMNSRDNNISDEMAQLSKKYPIIIGVSGLEHAFNKSLSRDDILPNLLEKKHGINNVKVIVPIRYENQDEHNRFYRRDRYPRTTTDDFLGITRQKVQYFEFGPHEQTKERMKDFHNTAINQQNQRKI